MAFIIPPSARASGSAGLGRPRPRRSPSPHSGPRALPTRHDTCTCVSVFLWAAVRPYAIGLGTIIHAMADATSTRYSYVSIELARCRGLSRHSALCISETSRASNTLGAACRLLVARRTPLPPADRRVPDARLASVETLIRDAASRSLTRNCAEVS